MVTLTDSLANPSTVNNKFIIAGGLGSNGFPGNTGEIYTITTGINHPFALATDVNISPKPSFGIFNLTFNQPQNLRAIEVYNVTGSKIIGFNSLDEANLNIDLSPNPAGVYLLKIVKMNWEISTEKIIRD